MPTIVNEYKPGSNEIFYHYCSADTFCKIIESKSLWFCDIRHMNDREELSCHDRVRTFCDCHKVS